MLLGRAPRWMIRKSDLDRLIVSAIIVSPMLMIFVMLFWPHKRPAYKIGNGFLTNQSPRLFHRR
jgi:hypothetical protein